MVTTPSWRKRRVQTDQTGQIPSTHHTRRAQCHVYVGETDNPSFGGGLPMQELAKWIARSKGPSGANKVCRVQATSTLPWLAR